MSCQNETKVDFGPGPTRSGLRNAKGWSVRGRCLATVSTVCHSVMERIAPAGYQDAKGFHYCQPGSSELEKVEDSSACGC